MVQDFSRELLGVIARALEFRTRDQVQTIVRNTLLDVLGEFPPEGPPPPLPFPEAPRRG